MRYLIVLPSVAISIMAVVMLVLVHILSNAAVEYDVKKTLAGGVRLNQKLLTVTDGILVIPEDFEYKSDDIYFLILGENGDIISGEYPEGFTARIPVELTKTQTVKWEGQQYLIKDVRIKNGGGECYALRGVVKKADIYSRYKSIETISYLSILVVFCVITAGGVLLFRQISRVIKNMCQTIEHIGQSADMSQRLEEDDHIYEIRVLAQANNRMLDRLEQMFRQQEQFTSDVAHELRTPIAVVMAQYQCVKEENATREELAEALEVIHRQSAKIEKIILQLLNFSRLEQGRVQLEKEEIDLVEIVQSVCEEQQEKAGEKFDIDMRLSPAYGTGDIELIAIVVQNLVTNAVKFSLEKGKIEVRTGTRGGDIFVSVRDYGIGIAEEELPQIFHRFYKCDKSRNIEGFGLGLPLAMKIAEKHGGTIEVISKLGEGSTFTLVLPGKENEKRN